MGLYNTQRAPFSTRASLQQRNNLVRPQAPQASPAGQFGAPPPMPGAGPSASLPQGPSPMASAVSDGTSASATGYRAGSFPDQGRGMMSSNRNTNPNNMASGSGVVAGQAGPQMQVPQGPAFDPNDPQNAALAGYMAR